MYLILDILMAKEMAASESSLVLTSMIAAQLSATTMASTSACGCGRMPAGVNKRRNEHRLSAAREYC